MSVVRTTKKGETQREDFDDLLVTSMDNPPFNIETVVMYSVAMQIVCIPMSSRFYKLSCIDVVLRIQCLYLFVLDIFFGGVGEGVKKLIFVK